LKSAKLTKSRFALALQCPRKLDYERDKHYHDARTDNELLRALAEGGHQVGELARQMFPDGQLIEAVAQSEQIRRTEELLQREQVTLFEATIRHGNLLVRADIIQKRGDEIRLIEIKAKGVDPAAHRFLAKKAKGNPVLAPWRPYLYDVAFQTYVLRLAYPRLRVRPHLLLLDKSVPVGIDGLNTLLAIETGAGDVTIRVDERFDIRQIEPPILRLFEVSEEVGLLLAHPIAAPGHIAPFDDFIAWAAATLESSGSFPVSVGPQCKVCQYYVDPAEATAGFRSGWAECMESHSGRPTRLPRAQTLFGLHRLDAGKLSSLLQAKQPLSLAEVPEAAVVEGVTAAEEITLDQRRQLQLQEAQGVLAGPMIRIPTLRAALRSWTLPLHFIDFETTRPAIPYHRNRTAHDQVLFQFSHHLIEADGRIAHRSQYLNAIPGVAPSVPVLRALRDALAHDKGTVVHWWTHEDTVLKDIRRQIQRDSPPDGAQLIAFIDTLTGTDDHVGRLVDLGRLVSKTVFYPGTSGSSSIKKTLPAALRHGTRVRERYLRPCYGTPELPSLNFKDWAWVHIRNGVIQDPYDRLDPLFSGAHLQHAVAASDDGDSGELGEFVANGGAALIAYDQLQQRGLPEAKRLELEAQLLRYCELDTFAMVMVYQALHDAIADAAARTVMG
jgi:hypothetical protein